MSALDSHAYRVNPAPVEEVLAGLYERHADRIFGYCRRRLRTSQEAEDATQNTFVAAMQALQRGTYPVCEQAWLFKIAENACNAIYRSGARRNDKELTDPDDLVRFAGRDSGDDALVGFHAALDSITENQRKAFLLRELRGLSYNEIAVELGVSLASVETLLYRARRGLARALDHGAGLRRRVATALDFGAIAASVKSALGGFSAAKLAAATVVVATASVPVGVLATADAKPPRPRLVLPESKPVAKQPANAATRATPAATPRPSRKTSAAAGAVPVASAPVPRRPVPHEEESTGPPPADAPSASPAAPEPTAADPSAPAAQPASPPAPPSAAPKPSPQPQLPPSPAEPQPPSAPPVTGVAPGLPPVPELPEVKRPEVPSLPALPGVRVPDPDVRVPDPEEVVGDIPLLP